MHMALLQRRRKRAWQDGNDPTQQPVGAEPFPPSEEGEGSNNKGNKKLETLFSCLYAT